MSKYEEERLRDLLRSVTAALNKRDKEYDESQRALYEARESEKTALATADGLSWQISDLEAENAKLREELAKARDPQRIGGQADPSSFAYAIEQLREFRWQHATNDEDAIPYINNVAAAHERENARLRELLVGAFEDMNAWQMVIAGSNEWGYGKGCLDILYKLRNAMQELGMEVVV